LMQTTRGSGRRSAAGDAAGVADLYAEDATLLPPDTSAIAGRAAIEEFWKASIQMGVRGAALETAQFEERQDLGFEVGRFRLRLEPNSGCGRIHLRVNGRRCRRT
jgi:ketosteroid isomerase-like protein